MTRHLGLFLSLGHVINPPASLRFLFDEICRHRVTVVTLNVTEIMFLFINKLKLRLFYVRRDVRYKKVLKEGLIEKPFLIQHIFQSHSFSSLKIHLFYFKFYVLSGLLICHKNNLISSSSLTKISSPLFRLF